MANHLKFETHKTPGRPDCLHCEELLADAVDAILSEADQAWFNRHLAGCVDCSAMLADAVRGAAWLEMLKTHRPEPAAGLVDRIIAQTIGSQTIGSQTSESQTSGSFQDHVDMHGLEEEFASVVVRTPFVLPAPAMPALPPNVVPFRPQAPLWNRMKRLAFEPRLAMTAAMAFFSIALTMNLTGVRLDQMHASDLSPMNLKRSYYAATASATRRYDSLRVVHVLESRVEDLRDSNRDDRDMQRSPFGSRSGLPESERDKPVRKPEQPVEKNKREGHGVSELLAPETAPQTAPGRNRNDHEISPSASNQGAQPNKIDMNEGGLG